MLKSRWAVLEKINWKIRISLCCHLRRLSVSRLYSRDDRMTDEYEGVRGMRNERGN
jgi:hypothetical protein